MRESITISWEEYDYSIKAGFSVELIHNLKKCCYDKDDVIDVIFNTLLGLVEVTHDAEETGDNPSDDCEPSA